MYIRYEYVFFPLISPYTVLCQEAIRSGNTNQLIYDNDTDDDEAPYSPEPTHSDPLIGRAEYLKQTCERLGLSRREPLNPISTVPILDRKGIFTVCVGPKVGDVKEREI